MTADKKVKEVTAQAIHQKKLNRRSQQYILAVLVAALITILLLSSVRRVMPEVMPFTGRPIYDKSLYGSDVKVIMNRPLGVDVSTKTNDIYVADMGNQRIVVLDNQGKMKFTFGEDKLKIPVYLALDSEDNVYVTDRFSRKLLIFDKDGTYISDFINKKIRNPLGIAIDKEDRIYVSDVGGRHCLHIFDEDGSLIRTFGETKKVFMIKQDEGMFYFPNGIEVDKEGFIYVADSNNHRIQVFDKYGEPELIIPTGGLPRGVAVSDVNKTIYVNDAIGHKISVYNKQGKFLASFSKQGRGNEDFLYPSGITIDKEGKLYITDRNNGRVQVFDTKLNPVRLVRLLLPLLPLVSLPWLFLLLGLLYSRKKRYIVSPCFIEEVLAKEKLDHFLGSAKAFYVTAGCHNKLKTSDLLDSFKGKITTRSHDEHFADKLKKEYSLTKNEAQSLALAHHKGLYQPVLLAHSKKLIKTAKAFGVEVMDFNNFLKRVEEAKKK